MAERACDICGKLVDDGRVFEDGKFRCRDCPPAPLFEEAPYGEPFTRIEVTGLRPITKEDRPPRRRKEGSG